MDKVKKKTHSGNLWTHFRKLLKLTHIFENIFLYYSIHYTISVPNLLLRFYYTNPLSGETEVERFWATVIPIVPQSW